MKKVIRKIKLKIKTMYVNNHMFSRDIIARCSMFGKTRPLTILKRLSLKNLYIARVLKTASSAVFLETRFANSTL